MVRSVQKWTIREHLQCSVQVDNEINLFELGEVLPDIILINLMHEFSECIKIHGLNKWTFVKIWIQSSQAK